MRVSNNFASNAAEEVHSFRLQSVRPVRDQNADGTFSRNGCSRENRMRTQSL